ncbi:MAG: ATP-binding protein, partial [Oscillospiraceae bacterium]|nr:ATP-binding protein [Oscillospiraceae bacterium]
GAARNYSVSKDIILDKGYCLGNIITLRDISAYRGMIDEITELKTQADSASSAKGLFLSHMSHEIRTPLNAIIGMIRIGRNAKGAEEKDHCLSRADGASRHLLSIINDILDLSKIESGKYELSYGRTDLRKAVSDVADFVAVRAEEKKVRLTFEIGRDVPAYVECDGLRLSQVMTNLTTNAVKFTPEGGAVTLTMAKAEASDGVATLRVEVSDTGIGISPEQQSRLFSSFSQADAGISREYGGTGLGLSISKHIVEMMGGEIWIESELGLGSKFIFTLKAKELAFAEGEGADAAAGALPDRAYDFSRYSLLIAEDIDINREIIGAVLEETRVAVEFAANGRVAYERFRESPAKYDLILMDVNMPEMDGHEATRAIRALGTERALDVPIIAMTANVFKEDIEKCIESGMDGHTGKPVEAAQLFSVLNRHLPRFNDAASLNA